MSNESSTFISNPQCDAADVAGVREILMTTEKGKPANTIENFKTVFCRDPLLHDSIRLNLLTEQIDIVQALGWHRTTNALTDIDVKYLLIFSHSALREGWDNPNVFQICTLKHGGDSKTQKRQEVGRGLRLCVNQMGERMDQETVGAQVHGINVLTVIASEGYAEFVKDLQEQTKEILYDRPRKASIEYFEGKSIMVGGQQVVLDIRQAKEIYKYLLKNDYIDTDDLVTQEYRNDVAAGTLMPLPDSLKPVEEGVHKLVQAIFDDSVLKEMFTDANKTKPPENPLNERFYKAEFQKLWTAINHHYAYTVDFDSQELIQKAIQAINANLFVSQLQYTVSFAGQKDTLNADMMRANDSFGTVKTKPSLVLTRTSIIRSCADESPSVLNMMSHSRWGI
ncbi:MAG: hypothetical protein MR637_05245 [Clostridiales bacterium]|nr:hypothetical protein [Clostridiales bacterium]